MVMFDGGSSPDDGYTMDNQTNGVYDHVEPVVGILSNSPLTDETVHDDDVFAYYDDAGKETNYVVQSKVAGSCKFPTDGNQAHCRHHCSSGMFGQCVWDQRGYIYAILDLEDTREAVPASLSISPWASEPDTRSGDRPEEITGTLTMSGLTVGAKYDIYRWDSAEEAFAYKDANKINTFTATKDTFTYQDPKKFMSNTATYYRCVPATGSSVVV